MQLFRAGQRVRTRQTLFLWDACQACAAAPRVDLSVDAYTQATGDAACERGHVGPFEVRVMDNFVRRSAAAAAPRPGAALVLALALGVAGALALAG